MYSSAVLSCFLILVSRCCQRAKQLPCRYNCCLRSRKQIVNICYKRVTESWPKFATNHVINTWQNEPRVSAASKAHVPRTRLSHAHIVVLFLCNINYHELYKFLFYKISKAPYSNATFSKFSKF